MSTKRVLLIAVLFAVAFVNGHPYEQADEEEYSVNDLDNDQPTRHTRKGRHNGKEHDKRHKRHFLNQIGIASHYPDYNPGYGYYQSPPVIGFCPPGPPPPPKPAQECPEKQMLKELLKVMQNPPSIRVICGREKENDTLVPSIGTRENFGDDEKINLATLEKGRNWGMVDQYPELSPEEQAVYGEREIELNPFVPVTSGPQSNKNIRKIQQARSISDRCDFVYTACCNDEETIQSCYSKNGCQKTYRDGRSCIEKSKDELHRYIRSTFTYKNGA